MPEEHPQQSSQSGNPPDTGPTGHKQDAGMYYHIASTLFSTGRSSELVDIFIAAARDGDYERIECFLQRGSDTIVSVDVTDKRTGNTPLVWAAKRGHIKIVQLLLKHGADITLRNYDGQTAVEVASPAIKMMLLECVEKSSDTPHRRLLQAAWQGNVQVVKQLLDNQVVDINCQNADGLTPLLLLCRDIQLFERLSTQLHREYRPEEVIKELLQNNANIHAVDNAGKTGLHYACLSKATMANLLVHELLQHGSQTDCPDRRCFTPIHCASQSGNVEVMTTLLDRGCEVNARGFAGATPLHVTAYNDHDRAATTLLQHGADVTLIDEQGLSALDVARSKKMKCKLREAWTEVVQNRADLKLAPIRLPTRDGSRLSMVESKSETLRVVKARGEVIFDGLPLNPFTVNAMQSPAKQRLLKQLSHGEKALIAEQQMLSDIETGRFSPAAVVRNNVRRLGRPRQGSGLKAIPVSRGTTPVKEMLPPVYHDRRLTDSPALRRDQTFSPSLKKSPRTSATHYQRSSTDLSKHRHFKLAKLSTYPMTDYHRRTPFARDSPISVTPLGTEMEDDMGDVRLRQALLSPGRHSVACRRRSSETSSSPTLAELASSCGDYVYVCKGRSVSTSSSCGEDYEAESPPSPGVSPRSLGSPGWDPSRVKIPATINENGSLSQQCRPVPTLEQMRLLSKSCTPVQLDSLYPNCHKVLPPTPTFVTQRSLTNLQTCLLALSPDCKDTSPRSSDEYDGNIKLANTNVMELQRGRSLLKSEFIIEESRPKDPFIQSSGSDSCDSVDSNPAKAATTSQPGAGESAVIRNDNSQSKADVKIPSPPETTRAKSDGMTNVKSGGSSVEKSPDKGDQPSAAEKTPASHPRSTSAKSGGLSAGKCHTVGAKEAGPTDSGEQKTGKELSSADRLKTVARQNAAMAAAVDKLESVWGGYKTSVTATRNTDAKDKITIHPQAMEIGTVQRVSVVNGAGEPGAEAPDNTDARNVNTEQPSCSMKQASNATALEQLAIPKSRNEIKVVNSASDKFPSRKNKKSNNIAISGVNKVTVNKLPAGSAGKIITYSCQGSANSRTKSLAIHPIRLMSNIKKKTIMRCKQNGRPCSADTISKDRVSSGSIKKSDRQNQSVTNSPAKIQTGPGSPKLSERRRQSADIHKSVSGPSVVSSSSALGAIGAIGRSSPSSSAKPGHQVVSSSTSALPNASKTSHNTGTCQSTATAITSAFQQSQSKTLKSSSGGHLPPTKESQQQGNNMADKTATQSQVGKPPLIQIFSDYTEPRVSAAHLEAPIIEQTPLIVNPFEDFISGANYYSEQNCPTREQTNSPTKGPRVNSAKSHNQKQSAKAAKVSVIKAKSATVSTNYNAPARQSSGRKRGARGSDQKSGDAEDKRPRSNTRVKSGKAGKRVRSGKVKGRKADKENLGEKAAQSDVALISGIGWHISTHCDDKSDISTVKINLDSDGSDSDMEDTFDLRPRPGSHSRVQSSPSPRFLEVKKTLTQEADLLSLLNNEDISPMNLDMSRNTIGLGTSTQHHHPVGQHLAVPGDEKMETIHDEHGHVMDEFAQFTSAVHRELLMSKLSPIPESPSLVPRTISALNEFSRTVKEDELNELLGVSPGDSEQLRLMKHLVHVSQSSLRGNSTYTPTGPDDKRSLEDQTGDYDSDSDDTIKDGNEAEQVDIQIPNFHHHHIPGEGSTVPGSGTSPKSSSGKSVSRKRKSAVPETGTRYSEVKRTTESEETIDDIVDEILSSTGPGSLNSSLHSIKASSSRNSTLTEVDQKLLKSLKNTDSLFHAKANKESLDVVRQSAVLSDIDDQEHLGTNPDLLKVFHAEDFKLGQKMAAMIDAGADHNKVKLMLDVDIESKQLERIMHSFRKMELHASAKSPRRGLSFDNPGTSVDKPPSGRPKSSTGYPSSSKNRKGKFTEVRGEIIRVGSGQDSHQSDHMSHGSSVGRGFDSDKQSLAQDQTLPEHPSDHQATEAISDGVVQRSSSACSSGSTNSQSIPAEDTIRWKKGNILGRGAFGTVWCGLTGEGELIAVKQIELNTSDIEKAKREYEKVQEEVELLKTLTHKNIVGYFGTSFEENIVSIYMQFVPGGSIASILARFGALEEAVFARYTKQILEGVEYLHANDVIHRDIKGGNIMLMPTGVIKLIDFGCAKRLCINLSMSQSQILKSMKGTPYWMAPEVVNETGHGKKSDIWSVACTVFEMATRKPPWSEMNPMAAIFAIGCDQPDKPIPQLPDHFSKDARDFVNRCLARNQSQRLSASEALEHRFITRRRRSSRNS